MNRRKLAVIGLDCATPQLVFGAFRDDLPNLKRLMAGGSWGKLRSTDPPITVPAWLCMFTGCDPGKLGIYGFRNYRDYAYEKMTFATTLAVKEPAVWDVLAQHGIRSIVLGVPPSYPVPPLPGGTRVGCWLTPDASCEYTWPRELKRELAAQFGEYQFDVRDFRTDDKDYLKRQIGEMTDQHFALARHLVTTRDWEFFAMVEIGLDRLHHGFWKYFDPQHRKFQPGSPHAGVIRDYYRQLDTRVGELLAAMPDDTTVLVVSDHGAQRMDGGFRINEWLRQQGYLVLTTEPATAQALEPGMVDWPKTRCWGEGGYYSRIMFNVRGRSPRGMLAAGEVDAFRAELTAKLELLDDDCGVPMRNRVLDPATLYPVRNGIAPDLMVYFGDLRWRSVGTVGGAAGVYVQENDTGPDDANHDHHGIAICYDPTRRGAGERQGWELYDVGATVLAYFGLVPPAGWRGCDWHGGAQ
ncbi:MAG TPA: alkaline phosphatase family protein [bacterium]|nr:alkaline phosphatase family protein [bacterium]